MFLLRTRRPHRYAMQVKLEPPASPPGLEDEGPDPDAAISELDWQLGDLEDEAEMPGAEVEGAPIDGVNFVNFEPPSGAEGSD